MVLSELGNDPLSARLGSVTRGTLELGLALGPDPDQNAKLVEWPISTNFNVFQKMSF